MGGGPDDRPALVPSACGWRLSWQPIAVPRISDASRTLIQMGPGPADAKSFRLALSVPGKQTGIGIKTDHPVVANLAVVPLCEPSPIARILRGREVVGTQQRNERGVVNAKAEREEPAGGAGLLIWEPCGAETASVDWWKMWPCRTRPVAGNANDR